MPDIILSIETAVKKKRNVFAFFNNEDLSGDAPSDSKFFFLEHGLSDKAWGSIMFIEKDFNFLRNWMDSGVKDETIIKAVQVMKEENIYDIRMLSEDGWEKIEQHHGEPLRTSDDWVESYCIFHPQIDKKYINMFEGEEIEMIGGGRYECLEELKLFLTANSTKVEVTEGLCYGSEFIPAHKLNNC